MALATQCPHCFTSFRVANDQLKLHAGLVRCGSCKQTFNGIEHLLAPGETPRHAPVKNTLTAEADTAKTAETGIPTDSNAPIDSESTHTFFQTEQNHENAAIQHETNVEVNTAEVNTAEEQHVDVQAEAEIEPEQKPEDDEDNDLSGIEKFDSTIPETPKTSDELAQQEDLIQEFSAQLETIEHELEPEFESELEPEFASEFEPTLEETPAATQSKKVANLTSDLEFELTNEERELVEQADFLHQLELENRAAILEEDSNEWSKNEPGFDEQSLLAAFAAEEVLRAQESHLSEEELIEAGYKNALNSAANRHAASAPEEQHNKDSEDNDSDLQVKPDFVLQAEKKRRYGKWQSIGLSFVCLVLTLGIAAQSIYFFRSSIAAEMPASKPHLLRACQLLGCQIRLPAERHMLELGGSELLILNEELMINTLAFQIQNKSNTVQEWPALELTLKDVRGKTVLQKVFLPLDYLNNKADLPKGLAARSESNHKLHFELRPSKASNYEVSIFYP